MMEYSKDLTLLYVEDNLTLLESSKKVFEGFFKSVESAVDGEDGISKYREYKRKTGIFYDLVITDITMPNLDGLEMSKQMKSLNSLQHIIVTTAHNSMDYLQSALSIGVSTLLVKPINREQLIESIYKVSQTIYDYKLLISHIEILEDTNMQLEMQNRELLEKKRELEEFISLSDNVDKQEEKEDTLLPYVQELTPDIKVNQEHKKAQIEELVNTDLYELKEIVMEIDAYIIEIINNQDSVSELTITILSGLFSRYSSVLSFYSFFSSLSSTMLRFSSIIEDNPLPEDRTIVHNIFVMLESFIYVLSKWHEDIASGDDEKINQFDASIISDIETIINIWVQHEEEEVSENSLDDIFDF